MDRLHLLSHSIRPKRKIRPCARYHICRISCKHADHNNHSQLDIPFFHPFGWDEEVYAYTSKQHRRGQKQQLQNPAYKLVFLIISRFKPIFHLLSDQDTLLRILWNHIDPVILHFPISAGWSHKNPVDLI